MSSNKRDCLHIMYWIGGIIIFILAVVALVSFYKAVTFDTPKQVQPHGFADSTKVEVLQEEVANLKAKVDSLENVIQQKSKSKSGKNNI